MASTHSGTRQGVKNSLNSQAHMPGNAPQVLLFASLITFWSDDSGDRCSIFLFVKHKMRTYILCSHIRLQLQRYPFGSVPFRNKSLVLFLLFLGYNLHFAALPAVKSVRSLMTAVDYYDQVMSSDIRCSAKTSSLLLFISTSHQRETSTIKFAVFLGYFAMSIDCIVFTETWCHNKVDLITLLSYDCFFLNSRPAEVVQLFMSSLLCTALP